jgi:hypothetical protein
MQAIKIVLEQVGYDPRYAQFYVHFSSAARVLHVRPSIYLVGVVTLVIILG